MAFNTLRSVFVHPTDSDVCTLQPTEHTRGVHPSFTNGACNLEYQVRIPVGQAICHRSCAYTVLQTVQMHGVYSAAYDTVHYEELLKLFEIRVGHSPGFGLPDVAILPHCAERDVKQYSLHFTSCANAKTTFLYQIRIYAKSTCVHVFHAWLNIDDLI